MKHRFLDCKECQLPFCLKSSDVEALVINHKVNLEKCDLLLYMSVDCDWDVPIELIDEEIEIPA